MARVRIGFSSKYKWANNFNGVFIIKNEFFVDSIYNNYSIDMGEISLGWAGELREFDFYVNAQKLVQRLDMKFNYSRS